MRMLKLPDERIKILVQVSPKADRRIHPKRPYYSVPYRETRRDRNSPAPLETGRSCAQSKSRSENREPRKVLIPDVMVVIENLEDQGPPRRHGRLKPGIEVDITQTVLEIVDPIQRLRQISEILAKEIDVLSMQQKIQAQAKARDGQDPARIFPSRAVEGHPERTR